MTTKDLQSAAESRLIAITDEIEAVAAVAAEESRELSDEDNKRISALEAEYDRCEKSIEGHKKVLAIAERTNAKRALENSLKQDQSGLSVASRLPARAAYQKTKHFDSNFDAFACGRWLQAMGGNPGARQWCQHQGIMGAMTEGTDADGGYAVPDPLAATIIRLVEEYGVFQQYARVMPMTSDTLAVPKRASGLTMYYPAEGAAITSSDLGFAQVNLTAVKYAQLAIMSTELAEDAVISMADLIATEMAFNFAYNQDLNSFIGDGTGTYGSITGIASALLAGSTLTLGSGDTATSDIVLQDLHDLKALLPGLAGINPVWFMNQHTYYSVVEPLLLASSGTDIRRYEEGGMMRLLGHPVVFTNVLKGSDAGASDVPIVFGDLNMGAILGQRRQVTIRTLNELYAANDQVGFVATMRSDTVIHETGTASVPGAIVMMKLAAS